MNPTPVGRTQSAERQLMEEDEPIEGQLDKPRFRPLEVFRPRPRCVWECS
jgi:hypothetical protein